MTLDTAYDKAASHWRRRLEQMGFAAAYRAAVDALAPPGPPAALCDVGCGTGDLAAALVEMRGAPAQLTLLEPAQRMLAAAALRLAPTCGDIAACVGPLEAHVPARRHDLVLAGHVIEQCADPAAALTALARMTAPHGALLVIVSKPHLCQWLIWLRWRHRWFTAPQMAAMAAGAGLRVARTYDFPRGIPARVSRAYLMHPFKETEHANRDG